MREPLPQLFALLFALLILAGCSEHAPADNELQHVRAPEIPRVVSAREALAGAHIPTVDPLTMNDAEVGKVIGAGAFCAFRYTSSGKPALAWKPQADDATAAGVVKLNGLLVALENSTSAGAITLRADDVHVTVTPEDRAEADRTHANRPREAELIFEIKDSLRIGYRGYYVCPA